MDHYIPFEVKKEEALISQTPSKGGGGKVSVLALIFCVASLPPLSGERFMLIDHELEVQIDKRTGWIVGLLSLLPKPMELLDWPHEGWGPIVADPGSNREERVDIVKSAEFTKDRARFLLTHKSGLFEVVLTYALREGCLKVWARFSAQRSHRGKLLLALCQPSAPRRALFSYPYSEGIVATGEDKRLKVGPAWHGRAECRMRFTIGPGFLAQFDITPLRYGLGHCGARISLDTKPPTTYFLWFTKEGEVRLTKWVGKRFSLLGRAKFEARLGRRHTVRISIGGEEILCSVDGKDILTVKERVRPAWGTLSLACGWLTCAEFDNVRVRDAKGVTFEEDFEASPIGSGGGRNWRSFGRVCVTDGGREWGGYPARFVDLPDRYILWGGLDLFRPVAFTKRETKAPWVALLPRSVKRGDKFFFELVYKVFDKGRFERRDRLRWYVERIRASDPFFGGEPVRLTHKIARHLPQGNLCFYLHGVGRRLKRSESLPLARRMEERMKRLRFTTIVYLDWYGISDREPPREPAGAWLSPATGRMLFGEAVRRDIKRLQREGFKVILYVWPVTLAFNPREPDKFRHYLNFLKRAIDFYHPDGIGYDMNWHVHKECLKLQFALYRFVKAKGRPMWVVVDYGFGTPSQLYADALLSEFGPVQYGFPKNPVTEATWALRTGLFNLLDFANFAKRLESEGRLTKWGIMRVDIRSREELERFYIQLVQKGLALGATWADYARIFVAPEEVPRWEEMGFRGYMVPFPRILGLTDLAEFSAKAAGTPILTETGSVKCHPDLVASAWADEGKLLVAAYRLKVGWHPEPGFFTPAEEAETKPVWVAVSKRALKRHGFTKREPSFRFRLIRPDGLPAPAEGFEVRTTPEALLITGNFPEEHLLLAEAKGVTSTPMPSTPEG